MLLLLLFVTCIVAANPDSPTTITIYVNSKSPNATNSSDCRNYGSATLRPCSTIDLGVEGLWYQSRHGSGATTLIISPGTYHLSASTPSQFSDVVDQISMLADCLTDTCVTVICEHGAGLSFIKVNSIIIKGIKFQGCSTLQTSTSANFTADPPTYLHFYVGLFFLYCSDVTLHNIVVAETPGTGVVFYNTIGSNVIENCSFNDNAIENSNGGGGVYIEFSYCDPGDENCLTSTDTVISADPFFIHDAKYYFKNSNFVQNHAAVADNNSNTFILPHKQYHVAFGRGGGLSVFFKGNATRNTITCENCSFSLNKALWGGGIFVEHQDWATNNAVTFKGCLIGGNSLPRQDSILFSGTGGGGARIGFVTIDNMDTYGNNVTFQNCTISVNIAYFGGGISLYAALQITSDKPLNRFAIEDTTFAENLARLGAGIDLSMYHATRKGRAVTPEIKNCTFKKNNIHYLIPKQSLVGIGSVYIDSLPAVVSGNNYFFDNDGTALVLLGSTVDVLQETTMHFHGNSGRNGGAISFMGLSRMTFYDNTSLVFINNSAQYQGGAIYNYNSGEHDLLSSRSCFIQFWNVSKSPNNWTAHFYFENNKANGKLNSIYSTTIIPCLWGGPQGITDARVEDCFCWNTFNYHNSHCDKEISCAPSSYKVKSNFSTIPGKTLDLGADSFDILNNTVSHTTVFIAQITEGNASFRGDQSLNYNYISNSLLDIQGEPDTDVRIQIETIDPIVIQTNITVHLMSCPPGFTSIQANGEYGKESQVCKCALDHTENYYGSYVRCYNREFRSEILRGAWMGEVNGTEGLLVGQYAYTRMEHSDKEYIDLPSDLNELNALFCNDSHRTGVLCGSCKSGYGPSVTASECVKCDISADYGWFIYILVIFVPITLFFCLIFVFSMSITFGPLNAFIFFAQMITTAIKVNADGMIKFSSLANDNNSTKWVMSAVHDLYDVLYSVWNLDFFYPWIPPFCISPNINTLTMNSLSYLSALYPLLLLVGLSFAVNLYNRGVGPCVTLMRPFHRCLARLRGRLNLRHPVAGGIATFVLISYTKFNLISLRLLTPTPLMNVSGHRVVNVMYIDGDIEFGSTESAPYIILAVTFFIIFGVIPPFLLVLPSILNALSRLTHNRLLHRLQPSGKLLEFLEVFHGCYKDGTNDTFDCRWFASLYFCFRIVALVISTASNTWLQQYCLQTLFFLVCAFMFAAFRPYKREWINVIDSGFFLILTAVTALSSYNLSLARTGSPLSSLAYGLQCFLILIPLVYCTLCVIGFFFLGQVQNFIEQRREEKRLRRLRINGDQEEKIRRETFVTTSEVSIKKGSRGFEDSTGVQNFLDFTRNSGRMPRCDSRNGAIREEESDLERSRLLNLSADDGYRDRTNYGSAYSSDN